MSAKSYILSQYVEQTGHANETRCNEYARHIRLHQPKKSVVEEQKIEAEYLIYFQHYHSSGKIDRLHGSVSEGYHLHSR
jgi:hypothetical protein